MPLPQPEVIAFRAIFSTAGSRKSPNGTSVKSAKKAFVLEAEPPPGFVTRRSFKVPGGSAGSCAEICVELATVTLEAVTLPIRTVAPAMKFDPVIVADVPPPAEPESGVMRETLGTSGIGVGPDGVSVGVGVGVGGTGVAVRVDVEVGGMGVEV